LTLGPGYSIRVSQPSPAPHSQPVSNTPKRLQTDLPTRLSLVDRSTMYIFLFLILSSRFIVIVQRYIFLLIWSSSCKDSETTPTSRTRTRNTKPSLRTRLSTLMIKYLVLPSFFPRPLHSSSGSSSDSNSSPTSSPLINRINLFNPSNPIRLQGCLILLYVLTTLGFCLVGYETFDDNFYWRDDRLVSSGLSWVFERGRGGMSGRDGWARARLIRSVWFWGGVGAVVEVLGGSDW
jgi:hypothetical protein